MGPPHSEMNRRRGVSPEETERPSIQEGGTAGAGQEEEGAAGRRRWDPGVGSQGGLKSRCLGTWVGAQVRLWSRGPGTGSEAPALSWGPG